MGENESTIIKDAQAYVADLFQNKVNKSVRFHTLQHTQEVVAACEKIAASYQLSEEDRQALMVAAWFHDTGFSSGQAKDHESVSLRLATEFLTAHGASPELTTKVVGCINATRMPQNPVTTIEMILCDADLFHLGTDNFREKSRLLREELKEFGGEKLSKSEWRQNNIAFLEAHKYFTTFGKEKLQLSKEKHLAELKEKNPDMMAKPEKKNKEKDKEKGHDKADQSAADAKAKKAKENQTERGIATVFRIMAQTQNNLSQMADSKANILISVNAIILSILLSQVFEQIQKYPNILIPVIMLVIVCVTVVVFAILATRPNVTHGTFTQDDIQNKRTNLLFFGNFYRMSLPDYDWAMQEMLNDRDYLYGSIVKDNYFLGVVLAKKYRMLRIAYNVFMFGLVITMIAFAVSFMIPEASEVYT
jgi:predicted metal-dependent HD superfamily phosphohydrolase/protein-S-isoprenylcysteine O-methyltransferase Ste14